MADNDDLLSCPACDRHMVKVYVKDANCNVDICLNGCGGIWFDNQELKRMDEQHENIDEILELIGNKEFNEVADVKRMCPVCGTPMVKNFVSAKHEIQIDECYNCGGKFMDRGELVAMRNQYATDAERERDVYRLVEQSFGATFKAQDAELKRGRPMAMNQCFKSFMDLFIEEAVCTQDHELALNKKAIRHINRNGY